MNIDVKNKNMRLYELITPYGVRLEVYHDSKPDERPFNVTIFDACVRQGLRNKQMFGVNA